MGFYQIKDEIMQDKNLSANAKLLHGMILRRVQSSKEHKQFIDHHGRPFCYFTLNEIQTKLGISRATASKAKKELIEGGYIETAQEYWGTADMIYVLHLDDY